MRHHSRWNLIPQTLFAFFFLEKINHNPFQNPEQAVTLGKMPSPSLAGVSLWNDPFSPCWYMNILASKQVSGVGRRKQHCLRH